MLLVRVGVSRCSPSLAEKGTPSLVYYHSTRRPTSFAAPLFFPCGQKYEEKRQRYLATKGATSTSETPRVRFGQEIQQLQNAAVVSGLSPLSGATGGDGHRSATPRRPNHQQRRNVPREPQPTDQNKFPPNDPYDNGDATNDQEEFRLQGGEYLRQSLPTAAPDVSSPGRRWFTGQEVDQQSSTVPENPKAAYARQLREQMKADAATAERARDDARRPVAVPASSATSNPHGLTNLPSDGGHGALGRGGGRRRRGGNSAGVGDGGVAVDRKAEYALQLREQMVADEASRRATEDERKKSTAVVPLASGTKGVIGRGGDEVDEVGSSAADAAKAEYARQLREQIETKENARRINKEEECRREHSSSSVANTGPAWIEGATEGRQEHRKKSNAEYADQLRAQIAAQRSGVEKKKINMVSRVGMHEKDHTSTVDAEEHQNQKQHQQHWQRPRMNNSAELGSGGSERHRSRRNQEEGVEGEADYPLGGGQRAASPQGGAQSSLARER